MCCFVFSDFLHQHCVQVVIKISASRTFSLFAVILKEVSSILFFFYTSIVSKLKILVA